MSIKKELDKINKLIAEFKVIVENFPLNSAYQDTLAKLEQGRAELVSKIGKK